MMKELFVNKNVPISTSWSELLMALDTATWNSIDTVNWQNFDYCPKVEFRMTYSDTAFLLQYIVEEQSIRAMAGIDGGQVWKDSCVEFFLMLDESGIYYNFEFNCIGTCLLAAGNSRNGREAASAEILSSIIRYPSLGRETFAEKHGQTQWDITLLIPYTCLFKHQGYSPEGKTIGANFYKCGDDLTVPHFISWNPIKTERPDFHQPNYFGKLIF